MGACTVSRKHESRSPFVLQRHEFPDGETYHLHRSSGLLIDLSHLPLLDEKPRRAVNIAGEFLAHAHIGNCVRRDPCHPAYGDQHPVFGIPGGENDVPEIREFLAGLMDIGFLCEAGQRILSFEVKPFGNQTTKEVVTICKAKLDEAWRRL